MTGIEAQLSRRSKPRDWRSWPISTLITLSCASGLAAPSLAQGVPLPGSDEGADGEPTMSAPVPGPPADARSAMMAPGGKARAELQSPISSRPAVSQARAAASAYHALPLNLAEAKVRLEELKNLLAVSKPETLQEKIIHLCQWLTDMTDAHNRLASVFARHDATKMESLVERQTVQKFSQLKNEAQLLKADMLIGENRLPEAISPLVEIVVQEPTSPTGKAAYSRLKELGFSDETPAFMPVKTSANSATGGKL